MISYKLNLAEVKKTFFDRKAVLDPVKKANLRSLSKAGAFVRRTAKGGIRKQKKISKVGNPPSSHTGKLKDFIFFGLDEARQSVFVGPIRLNGTDGEAPRLLEKSGVSHKGWRYRKRPFMLPALEKESPKFPGFWSKSVN